MPAAVSCFQFDSSQSFATYRLPSYACSSSDPSHHFFPGTNAKRCYDVFILAGQSNMGGRGGILRKPLPEGDVQRTWDNVVPQACLPPEGTVLAFTAENRWEEAAEPLHRDIDRAWCGVGPGIPFATSLLASGCVSTACLVPCALGSTEIDLWLPGQPLFDRMVSRTKDALRQLPQARLSGVLWYQGESDSYEMKLAAEYAEKLEVLFEEIRMAFEDPDLPILQVAIGCTNRDKCVGLSEVRHAQLGVKEPRIATVDSMGLKLQEDGIHLTTGSQCILGLMLAAAYMKLMQQEEDSHKEL